MASKDAARRRAPDDRTAGYRARSGAGTGGYPGTPRPSGAPLAAGRCPRLRRTARGRRARCDRLRPTQTGDGQQVVVLPAKPEGPNSATARDAARASPAPVRNRHGAGGGQFKLAPSRGCDLRGAAGPRGVTGSASASDSITSRPDGGVAARLVEQFPQRDGTACASRPNIAHETDGSARLTEGAGSQRETGHHAAPLTGAG